MAVMPNIFAGSAVLRLLPPRTIFEQHACQHKGATTSMFEIDVCVGPRECLSRILFDQLVPIEVTYRSGLVKAPVEPLPMLGGVRKRGIEYQTNNLFAADISYSRTQVARIEAYELNRATCRLCGAGCRVLCMNDRGKHQDSYNEAGNPTPFNVAEPLRTVVVRSRLRIIHGSRPPTNGTPAI